MKISVVIPCFNAGLWIGRTIQSVLSQRHDGVEIILVDDGSTDDSVRIAKSICRNLVVIRKERIGGAAARNAGFYASSGELVHFLDADDYIEGPFYKSAEEIVTNFFADVILFPYFDEYSDRRVGPIQNFKGLQNPVEIFRDWLLPKLSPLSGIVWRKAFIERVGPFDERLVKFQDGELVLRSMLAMPVVIGATKGNAVYNAHDLPSVSKTRGPQQAESEYWSIERIRLRALGTVFETACGGLAGRFYSAAKGAYFFKLNEIGQQALVTSRNLGLQGHPGTLLHRIAATLVGLRQKESLSAWFHRLLKIWSNKGRRL